MSEHQHKAITSVPTGIKNFGNTCYVNSTLQCLASCSSLYEALGREHHDHQQPESSSIECLACEFHSIIASLRGNDEKDDSKDYTTKQQEINSSVKMLLNLVGAVSANNTGLKDQHEDAAEFILKLFDGLQQQQQQQQICSRSTSVNSCDAAFNKETTFPYICQGNLSSKIHCLSCGKTSEVLEPFEDLELEISSALSLRDALRAYTRTESLTNPNVYNCSACNTTTPAEKLLKIHSLPEILRLQTKRFQCKDSCTNKLYHMVDYPELLDLAEFTTTFSSDGSGNINTTATATKGSTATSSRSPSVSAASDRRTLYELMSFVVHVGASMQRGHYISYVRRNDNKWFKCDDSTVTQVRNIDEVFSQQVYMLFYQRCSDAKTAEWWAMQQQQQQQHNKGASVQKDSRGALLFSSFVSASAAAAAAPLVKRQFAQDLTALKREYGLTGNSDGGSGTSIISRSRLSMNSSNGLNTSIINSKRIFTPSNTYTTYSRYNAQNKQQHEWHAQCVVGSVAGGCGDVIRFDESSDDNNDDTDSSNRNYAASAAATAARSSSSTSGRTVSRSSSSSYGYTSIYDAEGEAGEQMGSGGDGSTAADGASHVYGRKASRGGGRSVLHHLQQGQRINTWSKIRQSVVRDPPSMIASTTGTATTTTTTTAGCSGTTAGNGISPNKRKRACDYDDDDDDNDDRSERTVERHCTGFLTAAPKHQTIDRSTDAAEDAWGNERAKSYSTAHGGVEEEEEESESERRLRWIKERMQIGIEAISSWVINAPPSSYFALLSGSSSADSTNCYGDGKGGSSSSVAVNDRTGHHHDHNDGCINDAVTTLASMYTAQKGRSSSSSHLGGGYTEEEEEEEVQWADNPISTKNSVLLSKSDVDASPAERADSVEQHYAAYNHRMSSSSSSSSSNTPVGVMAGGGPSGAGSTAAVAVENEVWGVNPMNSSNSSSRKKRMRQQEADGRPVTARVGRASSATNSSASTSSTAPDGNSSNANSISDDGNDNWWDTVRRLTESDIQLAREHFTSLLSQQVVGPAAGSNGNSSNSSSSSGSSAIDLKTVSADQLLLLHPLFLM